MSEGSSVEVDQGAKERKSDVENNELIKGAPAAVRIGLVVLKRIVECLGRLGGVLAVGLVLAVSWGYFFEYPVSQARVDALAAQRKSLEGQQEMISRIMGLVDKVHALEERQTSLIADSATTIRQLQERQDSWQRETSESHKNMASQHAAMVLILDRLSGDVGEVKGIMVPKPKAP